MSAISKLQRARNVEELATEIEPLAQALAALADETRQTLAEQQEASRQQASEWSAAQAKSAEAWLDAAKGMRQAAQDLNEAANTANRAASDWTWHLWAGVLVASVTPIVVLLIASWLLLDPQITTQEGVTWLFMRLSG